MASPKATRSKNSVAGLVLTPGASAGRDHSALVAIDESVSALGVHVERIDFPYHKAGRRAPDRPPVLIGAVVDAAGSLSEAIGVPTSQVALGGRSMGGRMCSMAVAEGFEAAALVLVSYPLHPPGRTDRVRDSHFPEIAIPCLFASGTRDAFASREELEAATDKIPGAVTHSWIEGGDHGLRGKDQLVAEIVRDWLIAI